MTNTSSAKEEKQQETNYSKTNTQVENVDEADIVKTDGEYIYYIENRRVLLKSTKHY